MYLRKDIQQSIRVGLYKTTVRPVVTYSGESGTVMNKMERSLMTWKRKILRKMYGSVSIGKCMGQSVQENIWVSQYGKMYGSVSMGKCIGRSV